MEGDSAVAARRRATARGREEAEKGGVKESGARWMDVWCVGISSATEVPKNEAAARVRCRGDRWGPPPKYN